MRSESHLGDSMVVRWNPHIPGWLFACALVFGFVAACSSSDDEAIEVEGTATSTADTESDASDDNADDEGVADISLLDPDGDTDRDGVPNADDDDDDGDGYPDAEEAGVDTDGDNIDDSRDSDSDGDGLLDRDEKSGDSDGDGQDDRVDPDSDNDGCHDGAEPEDARYDSSVTTGCENVGDDDKDGVINTLDRCEGEDDSADEDDDGVPDGCDSCPDDAPEVDIDRNGCEDRKDDEGPNDEISGSLGYVDCEIGGGLGGPGFIVASVLSQADVAFAEVSNGFVMMCAPGDGGGGGPGFECPQLLAENLGGTIVERSSAGALIVAPVALADTFGPFGDGCPQYQVQATSDGVLGRPHSELIEIAVSLYPDKAIEALTAEDVGELPEEVLGSIHPNLWAEASPEVLVEVPEAYLAATDTELWIEAGIDIAQYLPAQLALEVFGPENFIIDDSLAGDGVVTLDPDFFDGEVDESIFGQEVEVVEVDDGIGIESAEADERVVEEVGEAVDEWIEPGGDGTTFVLAGDGGDLELELTEEFIGSSIEFEEPLFNDGLITIDPDLLESGQFEGG